MKTLSVDFDGVISPFDPGLKVDEFSSTVLDSAKDVLDRMKMSGLHIIIHTARINGDYDGEDKVPLEVVKEALENFLNENNIPYDEIWMSKGKPSADVYIDDRAYRFEGDWIKAEQEIIKLLNAPSESKEVLSLLRESRKLLGS